MLASCKTRELSISSRLVRTDCFDREMQRSAGVGSFLATGVCTLSVGIASNHTVFRLEAALDFLAWAVSPAHFTDVAADGTFVRVFLTRD
jgi:hypothetical protein